MGLVDYSDSESSETEETPVVKLPLASSRSTFQKVVDRTNPGKIRVSLPQTAAKIERNGDEPPIKRAKTGGGAFGGFNSFLPPPKRTGPATTTGVGRSNAARSGGLGSGVSLKTGATPGFSREQGAEYSGGIEEEFVPENMAFSQSPRGDFNLPPPNATLGESIQEPAEDVKLVGKPLMFKPLSVSRKPAKKKKQIDQPVSSISMAVADQPTVPPQEDGQRPQKPKVSLFSMSADLRDSVATPPTGNYTPMVYGVRNEEEDDAEHDIDSNTTFEEQPETRSQKSLAPVVAAPGALSLDEIASDLNLSAADRRQLFGRKKGPRNGAIPSATKIINFNTDDEYKHNEELRAAGEQVMHNPVRAILPGKHSLKQLVNAAASQREALEESFAKGKSNRAEASSRYGW